MRGIDRVFGLSVALIFSVFSLVAGAGVANAVAGQTTRVSVSSTGDPAVTGDPANTGATNGVLSANGRYVVFQSSATNLIPGLVTGGSTHVYRYDRQTHVTDLVSRAKTPGITPGNGLSRDPSVSADGRYVVFSSFATDLADADTNPVLDVFVRDMQAGTTRLVSATVGDVVGNAGSGLSGLAGAHEISDDGRYVVFTSLATNLVGEPSNGVQQIYRKDLTTKVVERASVTALDSLVAGNAASQAPALSGNGQVVAFTSASTNLVPPANTTQVYVRDFVAGTTTLESAGAVPTGLTSTTPALSFDGRYVVFVTAAHLDPRDADNGNTDVFLRDRVSGTTVTASPSLNSASGVPTFGPSISPDGRWVGYNSLDDQIVTPDVGGKTDIFLYDRDTHAVVIVSRNDDDVQADLPSFGASVSCDGHHVLFGSTSTNLVSSANGFNQLYVRNVTSNAAPVLPAVGRDITLLEAQPLRLTWEFSDNDSTMWTATVDWGDGSGTQPLALNANKTFLLDHLYARGAYDLRVEVTDCSGATGSLVIHVVVGPSNEAPVLPAFGKDYVLFESQPMALTWHFSDSDGSTSWSATVDYDDGLGARSLVLNADKTFFLEHLWAPGEYDVTVEVTDDGGATGSLVIHVVVNNVKPFVGLLSTMDLVFTQTLDSYGIFTDPGSNETYSATVNYGDGTPTQALALGPYSAPPLVAGSFTLHHFYAVAGIYNVDVTVTDSNGGSTTATMRVNVGGYSYEVDGPFTVGRNLPVKFTVRGPDGALVIDESVKVDVIDASGTVVAGPWVFGDQPSRSVTWSGGSYHVNVDTRDLAPGAYRLRVRFSSPTLTGEFTVASSSSITSTKSTTAR
jgi:Tol biopolymer transport system component